MKTSVIQVRGLMKSFDGQRVLKGVDPFVQKTFLHDWLEARKALDAGSAA